MWESPRTSAGGWVWRIEAAFPAVRPVFERSQIRRVCEFVSIAKNVMDQFTL
jgi:hypothetical protein